MKRAIFTLAALFALAAISGCGSAERKPTQESVMAEQAMTIAEGLRAAYVAGDTLTMSGYCTPAAYAEIKRGLRDFSSVKLEFEHEWMDITLEGAVKLRIKWKGAWKMKDSAEDSEHEGRAVFVMEGQPLKLTAIKRSSPFDMPRDLIKR